MFYNLAFDRPRNTPPLVSAVWLNSQVIDKNLCFKTIQKSHLMDGCSFLIKIKVRGNVGMLV